MQKKCKYKFKSKKYFVYYAKLTKKFYISDNFHYFCKIISVYFAGGTK